VTKNLIGEFISIIVKYCPILCSNVAHALAAHVRGC
jgi:hypothetical protein